MDEITFPSEGITYGMNGRSLGVCLKNKCIRDVQKDLLPVEQIQLHGSPSVPSRIQFLRGVSPINWIEDSKPGARRPYPKWFHLPTTMSAHCSAMEHSQHKSHEPRGKYYCINYAPAKVGHLCEEPCIWSRPRVERSSIHIRKCYTPVRDSLGPEMKMECLRRNHQSKCFGPRSFLCRGFRETFHWVERVTKKSLGGNWTSSCSSSFSEQALEVPYLFLIAMYWRRQERERERELLKERGIGKKFQKKAALGPNPIFGISKFFVPITFPRQD